MNDQQVAIDLTSILMQFIPDQIKHTAHIPQAKSSRLHAHIHAKSKGHFTMLAAATNLMSIIGRAKLSKDIENFTQDKWHHELGSFEHKLHEAKLPQAEILAAKTIMITWIKEMMTKNPHHGKKTHEGKSTVAIINHCMRHPEYYTDLLVLIYMLFKLNPAFPRCVEKNEQRQQWLFMIQNHLSSLMPQTDDKISQIAPQQANLIYSKKVRPWYYKWIEHIPFVLMLILGGAYFWLEWITRDWLSI